MKYTGDIPDPQTDAKAHYGHHEPEDEEDGVEHHVVVETVLRVVAVDAVVAPAIHDGFLLMGTILSFNFVLFFALYGQAGTSYFCKRVRR